MNINRNNYEEFFMLYADNELPAAKRKEIEAFVAANPDLQQELVLFQQFKVSPDTAVVFTGKDALMKRESSGETISITNYESFFVLYADDELTNDEKAAVEDFVYRQPQLQSAFELIQQIRLTPDTSVVFENKESLRRKEEDDKVVPFRWWKLAAAAMVLLTAGIFWLNQAKRNGRPETVKNNIQPVTNPAQPSLHKEEGSTGVDTGINTQPGKETIAIAAPEKEKLQVRNKEQSAGIAGIPVKKEISKNKNQFHRVEKDELVAANTGTRLIGATVSSIHQPANKAAINTDITAAANKSVVNQQLVYYSTGENDKAVAEQVVNTNANDKLEVLNTSVNTKNSLRGFFRKASRMVAKKTNLDDEDSKPKSILIGGFEIAVR